MGEQQDRGWRLFGEFVRNVGKAGSPGCRSCPEPNVTHCLKCTTLKGDFVVAIADCLIKAIASGTGVSCLEISAQFRLCILVIPNQASKTYTVNTT